ncbi:MAG: phosphoglucosamine mutase [Natronomonas sp.]
MELFGSSGVRGVVGSELTPELVGQVAAAAGVTVDADTVAVARDTRTTGTMFVNAASAALAGVGVDVRRLGIVPTPGVQAYAEANGVPVVLVTASHNPPEYNGVKLVGADGVEFTRDGLEAVEARVSDTPLVGFDAVGDVTAVDGVRRQYREQLIEAVDREAIASADLTVAVDPGHGAGCLTSPATFRELGCAVRTVNDDPDGRFPGRDPEPVPANLGHLRRLVATTDADVGIAHDGDADRAVFVDETGRDIPAETSFAALAAAELTPGDTLVSAVNVSQRVVDVVEAADATLELTPIGSTHLITRMQSLLDDGATVPIAGEGNGGIFFPPYRIARDGAYIAARFLELLTDRTASSLAAEYAGYETVRVNLSYDDEREREAMLDAAASVAETTTADVITIDGYRLDYGDGWVLVRPSGTEPLVRLYAEARTEDRAETLLSTLREPIEDAAADA